MNKITVFLILLAICSCTEYNPKIKGYMRFDLPEKKYRLFDTICPYRFDIPVYSTMIPNREGKCWYDLYFPDYSATLYLSYIQINNNLDNLLEDSHMMIYRHVVKADAIDDKIIVNENSAGLLAEIGGDAATSLQFFITDSVRHFLRGSLYFYSTPNRDSLAPLIDFFKQDVEHLMETVEFKPLKL